MSAPLYPSQGEAFRNGVEVSGNHVFVITTTNHVRVIDVFDPHAPTLVEELLLPDAPRFTGLEQDRLYVTTDDGFFETMRVIDVSSPGNLQVVGAIDSLIVRRFTVRDTLLYCTGPDFQVIDATDLTSPSVVGALPGVDNSAIDLVGDYAYTVRSNPDGLLILDVSDPFNPAPVGSLAVGASVIRVVPPLAYLVSSSFLWIVDVSDPSTPQMLSMVSVPPGSRDIEVDGDRAYVAAFLDGTAIVDVSDPVNPEVVGALPICSSAQTLGIDPPYLYTAGSFGGFQIQELGGDPPGPLSELAIGGSACVGWGDYLAVAQGSSLQIVDATNPTLPQLRGALAVAADDVAVVDTLLCVAGSQGGNRVTMVSIADLDAPTTLGFVAVSGAIRDMVVAGNTAYLAVPGALEVVDLSVPQSPQVVGSVPTQSAESIATNGTHVYLELWGVLEIVDVTNPALPVVVDTMVIDPSTFGGQVVANSTTLYAGIGLEGITVFDLADPIAPSPMSSFGSSCAPLVLGEETFFELHRAGLQLHDLTVAGAPEPLGLAGVFTFPRDAAELSSSFALLTQAELQFFPRHCPPTSSAPRLSSPASLRAWPNPGRATLTASFRLARPAATQLRVYNVHGRQVRLLMSAPRSRGTHVVSWDGRNDQGQQLPVGVYFLRLQAGDVVDSYRVTLVR